MGSLDEPAIQLQDMSDSASSPLRQSSSLSLSGQSIPEEKAPFLSHTHTGSLASTHSSTSGPLPNPHTRAHTPTTTVASTSGSMAGRATHAPHANGGRRNSHTGRKTPGSTGSNKSAKGFGVLGGDSHEPLMENEAPSTSEGMAVGAGRNGSTWHGHEESRDRFYSGGKSFPDSLTFEPEESEVWRTHEYQRVFRDQSFFWTTGKRRAVKRWVLTFAIGVLTGTLGVGITYATLSLTRYKFRVVKGLMEEESMGARVPGTAFFAFAGINLLYVLIANFTVWVEPLAAGSGIPEIKAYLNGVNLPRVVRAKTLLCKALGVTFTVGSGLPAGKEGPMVQIGSVLAAGVSQGKSNILGFDTSFSRFQDFRNDREKRDFVSCGAAAGVAAAFGAPIGGVLFSLEEGASYWSGKLTYRAFFCAMVTVLTLLLVKTAEGLWGQPDSTKMFSFGQFFSLKGSGGNYSVWELVLFIVVGCLGGLIGAVFNGANHKLTVWRQREVYTRSARMLEVLAVSFVMSMISFGLPLLWGTCTPLPTQTPSWTDQEKRLVHQLVAFKCDARTSYNELASLFFTDSDTVIKQLFHFRETGVGAEPSFSAAALLLYFLFYISMAIVAYGTAVPSGLFVPSLLSGAAFGRLFGHVLHQADNTSGTFADSGTYALVGAAAVLGGMARMTISLTVILLEATGDMQYVLPLMLTLISARWVGNLFNEGLYDIHIRLKSYPVLEPDMPPAARKNMTAAQIMSRQIKAFKQIEKVGVIYDVLVTTEHDCFPVFDPDDNNVLVGTVLRKALCVILQHKAFGQLQQGSYAMEKIVKEGRLVSPLLDWSTLERIYPRYPNINDVTVMERDRECVIDLRPFMNTAPYVINESASVIRTYRLFRTMGLRHVCVTNSHNQVVGIITRVDLLPDTLAQRYAQSAGNMLGRFSPPILANNVTPLLLNPLPADCQRRKDGLWPEEGSEMGEVV